VRPGDELWWKAREWFEKRSCTIIDDVELIAELCRVRFCVASTGKIQEEIKSDMNKRGQRSPDLADAFVLTFAAPLEVRHAREPDRYERAALRAKRQYGSVWTRV
jgi:hypothetical protein